MTATIYISGRNCARYVTRSLLSLTRQTWQDFHVVFVDDASTDDTAAQAREVLSRHFAGRHRLVVNPAPQGKAANAFELLGRDGSEFTAILDADDELIHDGALAQMADAYARGYDIVWTQYVTDDGRRGGNGPLDPTRAPRGQRWLTSHFFSFRTELFAQVPAALLQDDEGRWLQCACDFAIAFPLLDQTRRYLHLPIEAYRYTASNPQSHHNQAGPSQTLSSPAQQASAKLVLSRPALPCTRPLETHPDSLIQLTQRLQAAQTARAEQIARSTEQRLARMPFRTLALQRLVQQEKVPAAWLGDAGGWALDAEFLSHMIDVLDRHAQPRVLEFGSGRGSKILATLIASRGGSLHSIEHDAVWAERTGQDFERHGLAAHARVLHCPLVDVSFFEQPGRFYDLSSLDPELRFDVVIIDGPPAQTCKLARLPSLAAIAPQLAPTGFHILLDDYERPEEQQIVEIWKKIVPDLHYERLDFDKSVCQITS